MCPEKCLLHCHNRILSVNKIKIPVLVWLSFPLSPSFVLPEDIR